MLLRRSVVALIFFGLILFPMSHSVDIAGDWDFDGLDDSDDEFEFNFSDDASTAQKRAEKTPDCTKSQWDDCQDYLEALDTRRSLAMASAVGHSAFERPGSLAKAIELSYFKYDLGDSCLKCAGQALDLLGDKTAMVFEETRVLMASRLHNNVRSMALGLQQSWLNVFMGAILRYDAESLSTNSRFWKAIPYSALDPWTEGESIRLLPLARSGYLMNENDCLQWMKEAAKIQDANMFKEGSSVGMSLLNSSLRTLIRERRNGPLCLNDDSEKMQDMNFVYQGMNTFQKYSALALNDSEEKFTELRNLAQEEFRVFMERFSKNKKSLGGKGPSMFEGMAVLHGLGQISQEGSQHVESNLPVVAEILSKDAKMISSLVNAITKVSGEMSAAMQRYARVSWRKGFQNADFMRQMHKRQSTTLFVQLLGRYDHLKRLDTVLGGESRHGAAFAKLVTDTTHKKSSWRTSDLRRVLDLLLHEHIVTSADIILLKGSDSFKDIGQMTEDALTEMMLHENASFSMMSTLQRVVSFIMFTTQWHSIPTVSEGEIRDLVEKIDQFREKGSQPFPSAVLRKYLTVAEELGQPQFYCPRGDLTDDYGVVGIEMKAIFNAMVGTDWGESSMDLLDLTVSKGMLTCLVKMSSSVEMFGRKIRGMFSETALREPWQERALFGAFGHDVPKNLWELKYRGFETTMLAKSNPLRQYINEMVYYMMTLRNEKMFWVSIDPKPTDDSTEEMETGENYSAESAIHLYRRIVYSVIGLGDMSFSELRYNAPENAKALGFLREGALRVWETTSLLTDDPVILLNFGQWMAGSCQRIVGGEGIYNVGLLGTMANGNTKLVTATTLEYSGRSGSEIPIAARCQVRIAKTDEYDAALVVEKPYFAGWIGTLNSDLQRAVDIMVKKMLDLAVAMNNSPDVSKGVILLFQDSKFVLPSLERVDRAVMDQFEVFSNGDLYSTILHGQVRITGGLGPSYVDTNKGVWAGSYNLNPEVLGKYIGLHYRGGDMVDNKDTTPRGPIEHLLEEPEK